jgi:heme A synthase
MEIPATSSRQRSFARFAWAVLAYNLVVILWGALVRATGSGAGCGSNWPLCDGKAIPGLQSVHQVIEFTHRASVGVGIVLVVWLVVAARRLYPQGHAVRLGALLSLLFTLSEALVGAGLVLFKLVADNESVYRAVAGAVHLMNTFILVAALTLTGWWSTGRPALRLKGQGAVGFLVGAALILTLFVGASGAVTALGDTLYPARHAGEIGASVSATAHFLIRLRVIHPFLAIVVGLFCAIAAAAVAARRPSVEAKSWAFWVGVLFIAQIGMGFLNLYLLAPIASQLAHLLMADAVWMCLVLLGASALADGAPVAARLLPRSAAAATVETMQ